MDFGKQVVDLVLKYFQPHRVLRIRQRYFYNRAGRLRMRYVFASILTAAFASFSVFGPAAQSLSLKWQYMQNGSITLQMAQQQEGDEDRILETAHVITEAMKSQISNGFRQATTAIKKTDKPQPRVHEITIAKGDTIAGTLQAAGISGADAHNIVKAMSKHYDPRHIRAGQKLYVHLDPVEGGDYTFRKLAMRLGPVQEVFVEKKNDTITASLNEKELYKQENARYADIQTSLYGSAARAGIPSQIIAEVIRIYSWDVDFQRDIRQGDKLEVLYDTFETDDGDFARYGDVLYANLSVGGKNLPIYRYEMKDGRVDYFQPDGHSIRKTLMKTPVDGARISSGFGMRKHPVLGYNKMHKGMDFAAPTGTPIYAAGDGKIESFGRNGGYGNYVRIRHNGKLKTAYAHLHKYAKGLKKDMWVEQGQIIGYVGSTGRSTGPHLHYEVIVDGAQVNPRSLDLPVGEQLKGKELDRFKGLIAMVNQQYASLTEGVKFAGNEIGKNWVR